jgi:FR47-like protein
MGSPWCRHGGSDGIRVRRCPSLGRWHYDSMKTGTTPSGLIPRYTTDAGVYLDRVGVFLRRQPVEHSVLLSTATTRVGEAVVSAESNLWLWVEDDKEVVATAQHTPPRAAYLSTGPADAMRALARTLWQLRPGLPGVAGLDTSPQEFATEWSRLGGPRATQAMGQGLYFADAVSIPSHIPGRLRLATDGDAPLLRPWADQFWAEAGARSSGDDEVGPRIAAGLLFVWEVDGAVVSMAAVTVAQGGVSRVGLVYTPAENRKRGFASVCVASLTARELTTPGRTCMLYTDLANPTSNSIYQAVGYRRVGDAVELRFGTPNLDLD